MTDLRVSQLPVVSDASSGDFVVINKNNNKTSRIDAKKFVEDIGSEIGYTTGGGTVTVNLGYTPNGNSAGTVTNTAGNNATIPIATNSVAGLFTGTEKQKLSGLRTNTTNDARFLRKDSTAGNQTVASSGTTTFSGTLKGTKSFLINQASSIAVDSRFIAQISTYGQGFDDTNGSQGGLFVQAGFNRNVDIVRFSAIGAGYVDVPRFVVKDDGKVGIDKENPAYTLDVNGNISSKTVNVIGGGANPTNGLSSASNELRLWAAGGERVRFSNLGMRYVGPGGATLNSNHRCYFDGYTTAGTPSDKSSNFFTAFYKGSDLDAGVTQSLIQTRFSVENNAAGPGNFNHIFVNGGAGNEDNIPNLNGIRLNIERGSGSDRFNIRCTGDAPSILGQLFLSEDTYTGKRFPDADLLKGAIKTIAGSQAGNDPSYAPIAISTSGTSPQARHLFYTTCRNGGGGSIYSDNSANLSFQNPSDYRLKTNINSVTESVADRVKNINVVSFTDKWGIHIPMGFIAHELQEQCPEAVEGEKDQSIAIGNSYKENGDILDENIPESEDLTYTEYVEVPYASKDSEDKDPQYEKVTKTATWEATGEKPVYQSVDQTKLIPLLTKALQEALEEIDNLKARLDVLEGN